MAARLFTQKELNRIVTARLKRERDRLAREYENSLKRCMAQIHLMLYQEMCSTKQDMEAETKDTFLSGAEVPKSQQPATSVSNSPTKKIPLQGR